MTFHDLDRLTTDLFVGLGASLENGTVLVAVTALVILLVGRRLPAGGQALLWTIALAKFVVPCGPSLTGSLSGGLQLAGEPLHVDARSVLPLELKLALMLVYLAVVVALAARAWRRLRALVRRARRLPPASPAVRARVAALAGRLGVRPPDVRRSDEPVSPHVVGIRAPVLIVPAWLEGQGDAEEAFLLHELAHLRRRDPWILVVLVAVETAFFFWPPVRWAAARLRSAREAACDATAVERGPLSAPAYARQLVGAARSVAPRPACSLVLSGAVTTRLEERIDFLMRSPRRARPLWGAAALALWLVWTMAGAEQVVAVAPPARVLIPCPDAVP